jgi:hypothetical protein
MLCSKNTCNRNVSRQHQGKAMYHARNGLGLSVMGTKAVSLKGRRKLERSAAHGQKTGAQV